MACTITFSPSIATENIPAKGIKQANLYWVSDQAPGGLYSIAEEWIAPDDDPAHEIKRGYLYLRYRSCGGGEEPPALCVVDRVFGVTILASTPPQANQFQQHRLRAYDCLLASIPGSYSFDAEQGKAPDYSCIYAQTPPVCAPVIIGGQPDFVPDPSAPFVGFLTFTNSATAISVDYSAVLQWTTAPGGGTVQMMPVSCHGQIAHPPPLFAGDFPLTLLTGNNPAADPDFTLRVV